MNIGARIGGRHPKSKKEVREMDPSKVEIYCTDCFGEYAGKCWMLNEIPEGATFYLVGPDPYTKRSFYGQVSRQGIKVTVK